MNAHRGFTVIELVALIAIINISVFIGMPRWHQHLEAVKKANTRDTTFYNTGNCLHWQDDQLARQSHCRRKV